MPETLVAPVEALEAAYLEARVDPAFLATLRQLLTTYVGRPTPLYEARRAAGDTGVRVFLKREDLAHTGAHKINNAIGQALLARRMGKTRIVAETGAGQHGVATATACALLGLECVVYMGAEDMARQALNVFRMRVLGATVERVDAGSRTLKDAINEAMRDWVANVETTYYLLGSVLGPHPYPLMVREFQSVIGQEARAQILAAAGRLPDVVVACVGGGSNSMGLFDAFVDDAARAARRRRSRRPRHSSRRSRGAIRGRAGRACCTARAASCCRTSTATSCRRTRSRPGSTTRRSARSTRGSRHAAGPSTPGWTTARRSRDSSGWRARKGSCRRSSRRTRSRGCRRTCRRLPRGTIVLVNLSGRGDKDVETVRQLRGQTGVRPGQTGVDPQGADEPARRRRSSGSKTAPGRGS